MNKADIENDFHKRYGEGNVHTCFVPLPLPIIGAECYRYGGATLMCALSAGVWLCAGIRADKRIVIGTTADNIQIGAVHYRQTSDLWRFSDMLIRHFGAESGVNMLFHCDIPHTKAVDTHISHLLATALIMSSMFSDGNDDIGILITDFTKTEYRLMTDFLTKIRKGHAACINGKELSVENVPVIPDNSKVICAYRSRHRPEHRLKTRVPLPLCDLRLDAIEDKSGDLYSMTLATHNTLAAFRSLKNGGTDSFMSTFSDNCRIDGCIGKFSSDTDIYFTANSHIDYVMNEINRQSDHSVSFIVSDCSGGAMLY